MSASVLIRNVLAILVMTIVTAAPAHALCYDKTSRCDQHFLDKDLKRTTTATDIRCNPSTTQTSEEYLKDDPTTLLPAYKRLSQCAEIQDYDSRIRIYKTRMETGPDLLGPPVPGPCGKYYTGDECAKKDL